MDLDGIKDFASKYETDHSHPRQVTKLALDIFDVSSQLHRLTHTERELLMIGALLHDIGWYKGQQKHHKRAYQLIVENLPGGITKHEAAISANIARYHRKSIPQLKHVEYASLSPSNREIVSKLASLLRIADGLDMTHSGKVKISDFIIKDDSVELIICGSHDLDYEIEAALKKSDLFEYTYKRKVIIKNKS